MKTIREVVKGKRFNQKIYGKAGSYSIYINNEKVSVTDEQVKDFYAYDIEFAELSAKMPRVLLSTECTEIAKKEGLYRDFFAQTLEELKATIALFDIERIERKNDKVKAEMQIARYKGNIVSIYAVKYLITERPADGRDFYFTKDFEARIQEFKNLK